MFYLQIMEKTSKVSNQKQKRKTMSNYPKPSLPRMRTIKESAEKTGLAVYFVRQLVKQGKIKYVCAGRKCLVNLDSLIEYLNNGENHKDE